MKMEEETLEIEQSFISIENKKSKEMGYENSNKYVLDAVGRYVKDTDSEKGVEHFWNNLSLNTQET